MNNYNDLLNENDENKKQLDLNVIRATLAQNGYSFLRPIGKGGFGSVFLVFSNQYGIEFVVKVSNYKGSRKNSTQESYEFDQTEINNLINLNHPNIINMYKYFTDDHYLYVILEYCEGGSLKDMIQQNGRIRSAYLYQYCHQILTALKHCHDLQITHNDIKPANILIDKNQRLKLADFGLSKGFSPELLHTESSATAMNDHLVGKNGEILIKRFGGSKPYMAPELLNLTAYDPFKADIWSLGVTFYELATGHLPWTTTDLKNMQLQISVGIFSFENMKLPSSFCKIIHRMLEVTPSKRPSVDWLIEQPIFNKNSSGSNCRSRINCGSSTIIKVRSSMIKKSTSNGSIPGLRPRAGGAGDRIRSLCSFAYDKEPRQLDYSPIISSDNESQQSGKASENENEQIPISPLNPNGENEVFCDDIENEAVLNAAPRKTTKRSTKMVISSLPLPKTFI